MNRHRGRPHRTWPPFSPPAPPKRIFSVTAPARLNTLELHELLDYYESELCAKEIVDPRGHRVSFSLERFAHIISLKRLNGKDVNKGQEEAEKIKKREKNNSDFGGFEQERAQTLPWIASVIMFPTIIQVRALVPNIHPGTELYYKQFDGVGYKHSVVVCRRVGAKLLAPVTYFPRGKDAIEQEIVYHSLPTAR